MREDLKVPLRTAEFLRVGWIVFASLFRKEKLDLYLCRHCHFQLQSFLVYGDQKDFLFNLPARTTNTLIVL